MTRVRMLVALVGPTLALKGGDIYACDDGTAARLVAAGAAEWADPVPEPCAGPSAMVTGPAERAVKPRARGRTG